MSNIPRIAKISALDNHTLVSVFEHRGKLVISIPGEVAYHHGRYDKTVCCLPEHHTFDLASILLTRAESIPRGDWTFKPGQYVRHFEKVSQILTETYLAHIDALKWDSNGNLLPSMAHTTCEDEPTFEKTSVNLPIAQQLLAVNFGYYGHIDITFSPSRSLKRGDTTIYNRDGLPRDAENFSPEYYRFEYQSDTWNGAGRLIMRPIDWGRDASVHCRRPIPCGASFSGKRANTRWSRSLTSRWMPSEPEASAPKSH